jgi:hypothetical protein
MQPGIGDYSRYAQAYALCKGERLAAVVADLGAAGVETEAAASYLLSLGSIRAKGRQRMGKGRRRDARGGGGAAGQGAAAVDVDEAVVVRGVFARLAKLRTKVFQEAPGIEQIAEREGWAIR